ncbi:hypothetical protein [Spirillospora sp. NBC_01491]|uniref:hypothetical protein n=1 Tax=Spirillospora sp. NBC_01491 TaxID=2976007 RepID=UPI002E2F6E6E|nr:hypothetical protein [Spirillospora sp. NBC_01491]
MPLIRSTQHLPAFEEIRRNAHRELGDVEDLLRSDWAPGAGPTFDQVEALSQARQCIALAKQALDRAARS